MVASSLKRQEGSYLTALRSQVNVGIATQARQRQVLK